MGDDGWRLGQGVFVGWKGERERGGCVNGEKIKRITHFAAGEWSERFSPGGGAGTVGSGSGRRRMTTTRMGGAEVGRSEDDDV